MGISISGYYAWSNRLPSRRAMENEMIKSKIKEIYQKNRQVYGSPRIASGLKDEGIPCSRPRAARLMRQMGLRAKTKRKFKGTTDSKHGRPVAPCLLSKNFIPMTSDVAWVSDITYVPTQEGWLYVAVMMDLYSRRVVGLSMSDRMTRTLVMNAFNQAVLRRQPVPGMIVHSDRGSQYASHDYQSLLKHYGVVCSMAKSCYENASMESFFHTLKTELVYLRMFETREEAMRYIFEYIELFYNNQRTHSSLGYRSPRDFEATHGS